MNTVMYLWSLTATLLAICISSAKSSPPLWDNLRVTWNADPKNAEGFVRMPRTSADALRMGYKVRFFRHFSGMTFPFPPPFRSIDQQRYATATEKDSLDTDT